jgi:hypothetical protein
MQREGEKCEDRENTQIEEREDRENGKTEGYEDREMRRQRTGR